MNFLNGVMNILNSEGLGECLTIMALVVGGTGLILFVIAKVMKRVNIS